MTPFNPNATCPKCGGGEIESDGVSLNDFAHPEYDQRWFTCTTCGYSWPEAPLDREEG